MGKIWQERVTAKALQTDRRSGAGEYEGAEPERLHEVVDVVVAGDHLRAMVGHVRLAGTICQVSADEIEIAEIEGFLATLPTDMVERIAAWG